MTLRVVPGPQVPSLIPFCFVDALLFSSPQAHGNGPRSVRLTETPGPMSQNDPPLELLSLLFGHRAKRSNISHSVINFNPRKTDCVSFSKGVLFDSNDILLHTDPHG